MADGSAASPGWFPSPSHLGELAQGAYGEVARKAWCVNVGEISMDGRSIDNPSPSTSSTASVAEANPHRLQQGRSENYSKNKRTTE